MNKINNETFLRPLTPFLSKQTKTFLTIYCSIVGFINYFSMFGFKTPFKAASYSSFNVYCKYDYKTVLALGQMIGYTFSKFIGIKYVSEVQRGFNRVFVLLSLILFSQFGLVLFAFLPVKINVFGIFLSNLPLGMIWGILITFMEGREGTDFIVATMCASYMIAIGVVKDFGTLLMKKFFIDQFLMPAIAGAICFVPFCISLFLLHQIPSPNLNDIKLKTKRKPIQIVKIKSN